MQEWWVNLLLQQGYITGAKLRPAKRSMQCLTYVLTMMVFLLFFLTRTQKPGCKYENDQMVLRISSVIDDQLWYNA